MTSCSRAFHRLELKLLRGTAAEVVEFLKKGEAELAVAADIGEEWDRLDRWPLFTERFQLLVNARHRLASLTAISVEDLRQERFLRSAHCERAEQLASLLRSHDLDLDHGHEVTSERDLITLLEADFGVAFAPRSMPCPNTLKRRPSGHRARSHGLSLRRGGPPAHGGGLGHPEDAARRRLVAVTRTDLHSRSAASKSSIAMRLR